MKKTFREYHQYTDKEFKSLWKNCLFVFDTNTLLNMYRYSRKTVDDYFKVLEKLKKKKQLWIPYQVGYEFYENRINVISEYEKSYDEMLEILECTKKDIENKYKDHPFLDLKDINTRITKGLSSAEVAIKQAKDNHPNWLVKDDVLEKINILFDGSLGAEYSKEEIDKIKKEGVTRYSNKTPPGFKDIKKDDSKKYGDLILWFQIIDKAKESKKPIIFISGDVKEDWWLEKNGKRLMPLPQLKKELCEKADVDFHIYTADRFLKLSESDENKIDEKTIKEVRKIRELEEKKINLKRKNFNINREHNLIKRGQYYFSPHLFDELENQFLGIIDSQGDISYRKELSHFYYRFKELRNRSVHGEFSKKSSSRIYHELEQIYQFLSNFIRSRELSPNTSKKIKVFLRTLKELTHELEMMYQYGNTY